MKSITKKSILICLCTMGLITSVRCQEANTKKTENTVSPNIILILADDMG